MNKENNYLQEIDNYLHNQNYDEDLCEYIMNSFQALDEHYKEYIDIVPDALDYGAYINIYIETLKKVKKINIIRDINDSEYFTNNIKPINGMTVPIGYIKDEHGRFVVTTDNPQYYCYIGGMANNISKEMNFFLDATVKHRLPFSKETTIHELTHIRQDGFDLPWFILERNSFVKCLREGHAMREARYVNAKSNAYYAIPFVFNESKQVFENSRRARYSVYKYLYYKLETLLGYSFMNEWAITKADTTFLYQAYKKIDTIYGNGTFKKIYTDMCLILNSIDPLSPADLQMILEEQQMMGMIYVKDSKTPLSSLIDDYTNTANILNNAELFKRTYEDEKVSLLDTKKYILDMNVSDKRLLQSIDKKISNHVEEKYRLSLERDLEKLRSEIEVKTNVRYYKMMVSANVEACEQLINNPNYLTETIVSLESLVMKCLMKDVDKGPSLTFSDYQRYLHYVLNVENSNFINEAMIRPYRLLNNLKMRCIQQATFSLIDEEEKNLSR